VTDNRSQEVCVKKFAVPAIAGLLAVLWMGSIGASSHREAPLIGQLTVIAAAALLVRAVAVPAAQYRRRIVWPASAAIGLTGMFWTIERLV
jgi:hypothetical protein